jgi:hypothetical protein
MTNALLCFRLEIANSSQTLVASDLKSGSGFLTKLLLQQELQSHRTSSVQLVAGVQFVWYEDFDCL